MRIWARAAFPQALAENLGARLIDQLNRDTVIRIVLKLNKQLLPRRVAAPDGIWWPDDCASLENEDHVLDLIEIKNNQGPGFVASDSVKAIRVDIAGNRGPGIATLVDPIESQATGNTVTFEIGPSRIVDNLGDGIFIEVGGLSIESEVEISGNAGKGIHIGHGSNGIPFGGAATSVTKSIVDNGQVGATCSTSLIAEDGNNVVETPGTCVTGGIHAGEGDVEGQLLIVTGNAGPGIETVAGDDVNGDVTLLAGQLCGNTPDLVVAGTEALTGVNRICP